MEDIIQKIEELHDKYKDNEYVKEKLRNYIFKQLPNYLESSLILNQKRIERKKELDIAMEIHIKKFLSQNNYYFIPKIEIFIYYNGIDYLQISEDDILYKILTDINNNNDLLPWKYKIKNNVIKTIKDRSILNSIPESNTIQSVLSELYPLLFFNKESAKHFLISIGDQILGKTNSVYIIPPSLKLLTREIETSYYKYFGISGILNNFKLKYHGSIDTKNLRFFNCFMKADLKLKNFNFLNLICISLHYSERYKNSDNFIDNISNTKISKIANFCKDKTIYDIIREFYNSSLYVTKDCHVKTKDLIFIFLSCFLFSILSIPT